MGDVRLRMRVPSTGRGTERIVFGGDRTAQEGPETFLAKEWSISDDVMNVSDCASLTIPNPDGIAKGKFAVGQLVMLDESDSDVAEGRWCRMMTGRITAIDHYSDIAGGSNVLITINDLGWHLTSCDAKPLAGRDREDRGGGNLNGITFGRLLEKLIHPSWGFAPTIDRNNVLNRRLRQGRLGADRAQNIHLTAVLPYIQVEIGQPPWDIIREYAQREGVLVNVGARGEIIIFRPDFKQPLDYEFHYHPSSSDARKLNNLRGQPRVKDSIEGYFSQVDMWSTWTNAQQAVVRFTNKDPNQGYRKDSFIPDKNPLPFFRRKVVSDAEAITPDLRKKRAQWKSQLDAFNSWSYDLEVQGHSQGGHFITADTMGFIDDSVHKVRGGLYLQRVQRSQTLRDGTTTRVLLRRPILDASLTSLGRTAVK